MTDRERYYTTKIYLEKLARGMDPFTGDDLPTDTVLNNIYLCRAFTTAADVLDEVIRNGGKVTQKKKTYARPFEITEEQRSRIMLTEDPVVVSIIAARIAEVLPEDVHPVSPITIGKWLESQGLLVKVKGEDGGNCRIATEEGENLGIETKSEVARGRNIMKNYYSINAQAFIIANLVEIAAFAG